MNHLYTLATILSLSVGGALQGASNAKIPLRPTLPEPQATELQKLENSLGLKTTPPEPVAESVLPKEDHDFLVKAAEINLAEIESGMAAEKSTDPEVRKLAERIVRGHQTAQKQLEKLAASKGVALPSQPSKGAQEKINSLLKKTGHEFDKQFLLDQVKGHQEAILFFEKEAKRTSDADIKSWAQHIISGLKTHLALAREVRPEPVAEPSVKKSKAKHRAHKPMSD